MCKNKGQQNWSKNVQEERGWTAYKKFRWETEQEPRNGFTHHRPQLPQLTCLEHLGTSWHVLTLQATWPRQGDKGMSSDRGDEGREDMGERRESTLSHFIPGRESLGIYASMILQIDMYVIVYVCIYIYLSLSLSFHPSFL